MTIEEQILDAMSKFVSRKRGEDVTVTSYEENVAFGTCGEGTCDYEDYEVYMEYTDSNGVNRLYFYDGSLGDFVRELS